ncbi:MAG: prolyl oligopeptidase family serine peptidase [Bacteroidia bacterium]|nr:prolyl oligopeptidase family serine peptidase [Bacteroidia bacterium]
MKTLTYPPTRQEPVTDTYFGTTVPDPYRWLEDDRSPETEAWVKAQNEVTFGYLSQIPYRADIRKRLEALSNYARVMNVYKEGPNIFFNKNEGLQNQSVLYIQAGLDAQPEVLIDPNQLSDKGTVSISLAGFSEDHRYVAVLRQNAGSDWGELSVMDLSTRQMLPDKLSWIKFSGAAWYGNGFFYSRYPEPASGKELSAASEYQRVYYHKLGDAQEQDQLIFEDPSQPNRYHNVDLTEDRKYLILYKRSGTDGFETWFKATDLKPGGFKPLFTGFDHKNTVIDHAGGKFIVQTDVDAPRYRVVAVDPANPAPAAWETVIPEKAETLDGVTTAGGKLFASYLKNACSSIIQYNTDGSGGREIQLPALGTAAISGGLREDSITFYSFSSFTFPPSVYRYNVNTGESSLFFRPQVPFDPEAYETRQVWYPSRDGEQVSMFIVHKKGLKPGPGTPALLYGYGGFNVNLTPGYSSSRIFLLEQGGIYAMPNLRGGGEYGEAWHKAGMLEKKQTVFDDFIAAGEYLIREGYTSSAKLAIAGGSNGGLLVGACANQRPDLFQVALPAVGVMDMLRYHKFTVGWGWIPEYGCADSSEAEFKYLSAYSPYHNLKPGVHYPATFVTTADHDDRVVPAHSFKYAARIQEVQSGPRPVLIRIETDAGHGAGKPISKVLDEDADEWAFMLWNMGITSLAQP